MGLFVGNQPRFPQSVFYPSLVVNLQIRFDEGLALVAQPKAAEDLAGDNAVASAASTGGMGRGPVVLQTGADNLSQIVGLVPRSASVDLPGYRQAGTFNVDLEFRDLPLDPRVIRSMAVAIHLDAVPASDFGVGMTQFRPTGRRPSVIETTPDNILIAGLADTITTAHNSSGSTVHFEGRDLRGILLDTPISSETLKSIDLQKPIDQVVAHIVQDLHPQGGGVEVSVNASEWPNGVVPSPYTFNDATRVNVNALGGALRPTAKGEVQQVSFWDLITTYCFFVGGVPHFVGSVLRIRPARSLFDARRQEKSFDPSIPTPFLNGEPRNIRPPLSTAPEQFAFRRLVFGRDIQDIKFERKLTGVKVPVVTVTSYDTGGSTRGTERLLKVQYPPTTKPAARATSVPPSGKVAESSGFTINVPGIKNKDRLLEIAKDVYQEIGRQEMGGSVETKNLASFGGNNQDPDLVRLRPGDPIEFRVDASGLGIFPPPISELTQSEGRSFEQQVQAVAERIGDENLARVLVAANRGEVAGLQKVFRTANVSFSWDKDSGVGISFDFQNFVEARYAIDEEPSTNDLSLEPIPSPFPQTFEPSGPAGG